MTTIILPISRSTYLKPVFDCLKNLDKPDDTELLIITDGDKNLERAVDKRLDTISFAKIQVINYGDKPATTINERRYRIANIHNMAKHYVSDECWRVFLIEDDTVYPPDTLMKMLEMYRETDPRTGFVQGVQLGRHNAPYIGGWIADSLDNPSEVTSVMPLSSIYTEIDAGGLYCCLVREDLYKEHHFEPLDKVGTNGLSCDVNFGLSIKRQGFRLCMDWSIQTDHIGERGSVNIGNTKPCQLQFTKENNKWSCKRL